MRLLLPALPLLACLALPVAAQVPPTQAPAASASPHARITWEQRFKQANISHDGHLTLDQAKAGYASIAPHFAEIDVANRGYITEDDVRVWHKQQRLAHQKKPAEDKLRPRHAFERSTPERPPVKASAPDTVPLPNDSSHVGPDTPTDHAEGRSSG